jgi:hypothetical protein
MNRPLKEIVLFVQNGKNKIINMFSKFEDDYF